MQLIDNSGVWEVYFCKENGKAGQHNKNEFAVQLHVPDGAPCDLPVSINNVFLGVAGPCCSIVSKENSNADSD